MENPKLADAVIIKKRGDMTAFIHADLPNWVAFHKEGARIVELLDGTRTQAEIAAIAADEFDMSIEDATEAVTGIIAHCENKGFFKNVKPDDPMERQWRMKTLYINITKECNLRCTYCYLDAGISLKDELSVEEIKRVFAEFKAMGQDIEQTIIISGGEPLIREDLWDIVEYAKSLGFILVIATNGILIDKETAVKLKKYFGGVQISLDGDEEMHDKYRGKGSFDGALEGIMNLVAAGLTPSISAAITKENFKSVQKIWEVCKKYNLKHVKTNPIIPLGRAGDKEELMLSKDEYVELWRESKENLKKMNLGVTLDNERSLFSGGTTMKGTGYSCGGGLDSLSVESNGDVFPCQASHLPEFKCGSIRESSLEDIWRKSAVTNDWKSRTINEIAGCKDCEWKMYCGGGCLVQAAVTHGTIHAPDTYCDVYKIQYEETFWNYINKLLGSSGDE
ncbi:MAG: radical SAM protein [Thermoplasmata archaeon]|nr:radical SAM protein [Thermoplasmata archaeon]